MTTTRVEAFSDGVIAILITIMVLELKIPEGASLHDLTAVSTHLAAYVISFIFLGIYWTNHHHMMQVTEHVNGAALWANLHLLFWLSLIPATTAWVGENPLAAWPAAVYGIVMLGAAIAYYVLQNSIIRLNGAESFLARALGSDFKGKISPALYAAGVFLAFVHPFIADGVYVFVALMWLVPDRRIESKLEAA
jgi:uncharacterized membrane protein